MKRNSIEKQVAKPLENDGFGTPQKHTVRLTPISNPVPGYQEFLVDFSETIVGLVKKIRSSN